MIHFMQLTDGQPITRSTMTMSTSPLHVIPEGEAWAVKIDSKAEPSSLHPTRGQAIAGAWELIKDRDEAEVVVHDEHGRARSSLIVRLVDEGQDAAFRADALRVTPSNARLKAGIGKYPPPPGDFDVEEMAC